MQYFLVFLTALFISTVVVAVLIRFAKTLRLVDFPDNRKIHLEVTPRIGGIGMVLGSVIARLLWMETDENTRFVFCGIAVLSGFGIIDDRFGLSYRAKFLGQFIAVFIVVFGANVLIRKVSFYGIPSLPDFIAYPLTIAFLVGSTNAMNFSDGMDGLAAGLSLLTLVCIAYLAALADHHGIVAVCIAIMGATLGFLRYNTHPAVAFMGDAGSLFLGFSVGVLAVLLTQNSALSGVLPLLIIGLPIVDTLRVMGERMARGTSLFMPDRNHLQHKLLDLGFDHYESVLVIYALQVAFVLPAFFLRYESDGLIMMVFGALFAVICGIVPLANRLQWRRGSRATREKSLLTRSLDTLIERAWLETAAYFILSLSLPSFLLLGVLFNPAPESDLGLFACVLTAAWILSLHWRLPMLGGVSRVAMYSCISLVIYTIGINDPLNPELEMLFGYGLVAFAFLVAMGVIFSRHRFFITPSDYLVMFILVVSASLPVFGEINYARLAAEASIMVYALEFVLSRPGLGRKIVQIGFFLVLVMVALTAIWTRMNTLKYF